jgi:hypothetical protein
MTQDKFDSILENIFKLCNKKIFVDESDKYTEFPTNRIELRNYKNEWLFDIQYIGDKHFWVSSLVWDILEDKYSLNYKEIRMLMKKNMKKIFGNNNIIPQ